MNEILLILIFYIIPGLFVGLAVYSDEEIQSIGDFVEYLWAVLIPFVNIFMFGVLLVNFIFDFIKKKIKLADFWEKIKNTKIKNKISKTILPTYTLDINIESPKRETLEEVAEKYANKKGDIPTTELEDAIFKQGFTDGAKWQQEQDKKLYSEEEVKELLSKFHIATDGTKKFEEKWFEQFKKK